MKAVKTVVLITIIAALIVGIAFAQDEPRPMRARTGMGGMAAARMGANPTRMILMMREQLNLTDEQATKLEAYQPKDPNAVQKAQTELMNTQRELNLAIMGGDETLIKELCKKIGTATEKVSLLQVADYKAIKGILTADQFKQYQEILTAPRPTRTTGGPGMGAPGAGGPGGNRPGGPGGPPNQ